jgi:hypothetical protein
MATTDADPSAGEAARRDGEKRATTAVVLMVLGVVGGWLIALWSEFGYTVGTVGDPRAFQAGMVFADVVAMVVPVAAVVVTHVSWATRGRPPLRALVAGYVCLPVALLTLMPWTLWAVHAAS